MPPERAAREPAPTRPPRIAGYTTGRLLGFGASAEVWAAVQDATGERVALKVLQVAPAERSSVLRECLLLRRIDHPHVIRLREVVDLAGSGPDEADDPHRPVVLVLDRAPGGSLAALVRTRGAVEPGELVTILSPLARALADLHARGLVHGDVSPGNVLFADDGRPLLSDLGVATLVGLGDGEEAHGTPGYVDPAVLGGAPVSPASDVYGLCATAWFALTGRAPEPAGTRAPLAALVPQTPLALASVVEQGLHASPPDRPDPAGLALQVYDAAEAVPVRLVPTDPGAAAAEVVTHRLRRPMTPVEVDDEPVRRRRRPVLVGTAALAALGLTAGAVWGVGVVTGGPRATPSAAAAAATAPPASGGVWAPPPELTQALGSADPLVAVPALSQLRALAFSGGRTEPLRLANVPDSAAAVGDLAVLASLEDAGVVLDGLELEVVEAELVRRTPVTAVVRVSVVTGEHRRVRRSDGSVVDVRPASAARWSQLTLTRTDDGWRVREAT